MNRTDLLRQLQAHQLFDAREGETLERPLERIMDFVRDFVRDNETCFDRNLKAGRLTGAAWIIDRDRTHAPLTRHARLGVWLQLGGRVEDDPDMFNAAWREAREESGLDCARAVSDQIFDVDVHEIPATTEAPAHFHYDIRFLFEADRGAQLVATAESKAPRWIALDEITQVPREESVLRMVRKISASEMSSR